MNMQILCLLQTQGHKQAPSALRGALGAKWDAQQKVWNQEEDKVGRAAQNIGAEEGREERRARMVGMGNPPAIWSPLQP